MKVLKWAAIFLARSKNIEKAVCFYAINIFNKFSNASLEF